MIFKSKKDLLLYLSAYMPVGMGASGRCFKSKDSKFVLKIDNEVFFDDFPDRYYDDTTESFNNFKGLDNSTFIFGEELIYINNLVVGYKSKYIKGKNLYKIDPLRIDLDRFEKSIQKAHSDVLDITKKGVGLFDVVYNIMYGSRLFVKDFGEFSFNNPNITLSSNIDAFDLELFYFLVEGYFNNFVNQNKELSELYKSKENIRTFLFLFRKYLSEYQGFAISRLGQAKECMDECRNAYATKYERELKLKL